ncbi:hypothetical protein [Salicibibacter kimchii]|nr:hypothetical protein [Salicibibacter kimchii]
MRTFKRTVLEVYVRLQYVVHAYWILIKKRTSESRTPGFFVPEKGDRWP